MFTTTTDANGHYTLNLAPSPFLYSLSVRADLYYVPPRPTEVKVTDANVLGVDIVLKRDRAKVTGPSMEFEIKVPASPGQTVTIDLAQHTTAGSYPLAYVEYGMPNLAATPPGGRIVLDHEKRLPIGDLTFSGTTVTFTASKSKLGAKAEVNVLALDPSNFGGGASLLLSITAPRTCSGAKAALAKARKARAAPGAIRKAQAAVKAACGA